MAVRSILRSLEHRNFRLFFLGQLLSLIGTWMQLTALPWYILHQTESATWLGIVDFAGKFPALLFTPVAGVVADRVNRHRLLLVTQSLSMVQAFTLAACVSLAFGNQQGERQIVAVVIVLSCGLSVVNAFDLTGRQSFLHEMLDRKEDLGNAIALNSSTFNAARLVGPSLAGLVMGFLGAAECFFLNGVSFLAVIVALLAMRVQPAAVSPQEGKFFQGLRDGVAYALRSRPIRAILVLVALISLLGVPYVVLIPVYVRDVLQGNATLNGFMVSAPGVGALTAALVVAARRHVLGLLRGIIVGPALVGVGMLAMSFVPGPAPGQPTIAASLIAAFLLFGVGFVVVAMLTSCNAILQTIVQDEKRGRVVSLYAMAFGINPLGSVVAGALAERIGVQLTLRAGGMACIAATAAFVLVWGRTLREEIWALHKLSAPALAAKDT